MLSVERIPHVRPNPGLARLRPSPTLAFSEKAARLRAEGRIVYQFGFGQSPFPVPEPVVAALRAHAERNAYLPVRGLPALRDAVAAFHRRFNRLPYTGDDILIGPGSKELIFLLQLTCQAELLVPSPSWVSYEPQATLLGRRVTWLPTHKADGWRLRADTLAAACEPAPDTPRLLILNSPSNPTGLALQHDELDALAQVAAQYRLLVLSDEIYGELHHGDRTRSIAEFYPDGTIVSSGLSKWCSAGGWRLGALCFPSALRGLLDAMAIVASETYSTVSAPIQYAAVTAYTGGPAIERYLFQSRRILRALGDEVCRRLRAAGIDVDPSQGAYYLFPDFTPHARALQERGIRGSTELCARLLEETGVGLLPGADFGRPPEELTCRLAYVNFDGAASLAAVEAVADDQPLDAAFLDTHCREALDAIDLIGRWVS